MTPDPNEQRALVERARTGDGRALDLLWRSHRRWVAAIVIAHRPRTVDVDDLMQEVAVKFLDKIDTLRDPEAFRPWLRRIVLNVCRGTARGLKPTLTLVERGDGPGGLPGRGEVATPAAGAPRGDEVAATDDAARHVLAQALTLPPEYREPLLLRCLRSLSYQQIGELLDLPVTTIETRLARARRMLREEIGSDVQDPA